MEKKRGQLPCPANGIQKKRTFFRLIIDIAPLILAPPLILVIRPTVILIAVRNLDVALDPLRTTQQLEVSNLCPPEVRLLERDLLERRRMMNDERVDGGIGNVGAGSK